MDDSTLSHGSAGKPQVLRESEFYGGCIRVKISVKNTSSLVITGVALELESDEKILHFDRCEPEYPQKNGKIILDTINPHTDRTIAFYLDPLICAKEGTDINCRVNFKYADGKPDTVNMEPLKIQVVCPIFRTEHDINIGRLKELIEELHSHDSKVYTIPKRVEIAESLKICRNVIQQHDVRHIKTFKTTDDTTYECWYFGKTKVTKKDLVIKCAIRKDTESIEIFVSGNDPKDITGLLAEIGRNLTKEFDKIGKVQPVFNVVVKNSMVKGSNLLSFCDLDGVCGGNVVIEDSFVEGSNVASGRQEDEGRTRIEEQKKLEEARKKEKQREKEDKPVRIEQGGKSSSGKWFFGVIIIFGILALGWYGMQGSNSPQVSVNPAPAAAPAVTDMQKTTQSVIPSSAVIYPHLSGYVTDNANMIDQSYEAKITQLAQDIEKELTVQIAVVTIQSLEGESMEAYAATLFEKAGIGKMDKDNSLLIILSKESHDYRFEMSYGIEGTITDSMKVNIGDRIIVPNFRNGDYGKGIYESMLVVQELLKGNQEVISQYSIKQG